MVPRTKTKILIVGAGPGGLTLAILLERAGIDYLVLERATSIRPLGSAIALSSVVQPLFEQLGMLDEISAQSKPISGMTILEEEDLSLIGTLSNMKTYSDTRERYGYYTRVMPRPTFYNILLSRLPKEKILLGKKVQTSMEDRMTEQMIVTCMDGTVYEAALVVGADGAYSTIRKQMFESMEENGVPIPKQDKLPLKLRQHCVLGVTEPLPTEDYPTFKDPYSDFQIVLSKDRRFMSWVMVAPDNRICWLINRSYTESEAATEETTRAAEWGLEEAQEMLKEVRNFRCPYSGTVGELIDKTRPNLISKVMLEEKLFQTWYNGKTVLMGDAIHKLVPFSGEGGAQAILDAVTLANALYDLPSLDRKDITAAFKKYYDERFPVAQGAIDFSKQLAQVFNRTGWIGNLIRKIALGNTPAFMMRKLDDKINDRRPQAIYLPFAKVPGLVQPRSQIPSTRKIGEGPLAVASTSEAQAAEMAGQVPLETHAARAQTHASPIVV